MKSTKTAAGPTLSTVMFVVGLALAALKIPGTPWVGIAIMVVVVLINVGLLLAQRNKQS